MSSDGIKLYLLGEFRLEAGGRRVSITSRPARSLLALLALNADRSLPRDKVSGELWPDSSESNARTSLRQTLWQLRSELTANQIDADHLIRAGRSQIGLAEDIPLWIDTVELERDPSDLKEVGERIDQAMLFKGELLPGVYDEWVSPYRSRLAARGDQLIERLLDELLASGQWDEAIPLTHHWLSVSGPTETAYRGAMVAYAMKGDSAAALAAYRDCVSALEEELGVPPSPETERLYRKLEQGEPLMEAQVRSGHPGTEPPEEAGDPLKSVPEAPALFVGRRSELERLLTAFDQARQGRGTVCFVSGASGTGKTALIHEFIRSALETSEQAVAAVGTCEASIGMGDPFAPFREIMALLAGDLRANPVQGAINKENGRRLVETRPQLQAAINRYGPDLSQRFLRGSQASTTRGSAPPVSFGGGVVGQATRCLLTVANSRPLILVVDDLQWADKGTLTLFFQLGRRLRSSACLLIGVYRPEGLAAVDQEKAHPLQPVVTELVRVHGAETLDLDDLSPEEGRRFVRLLLDSEPNRLDDSFQEALFEQTGGQPLFTIELLRSMEAQGAIVKDQDGRWVPGDVLEWGELPPRVEAALEGRIARLDQDSSQLLEVAAVEGGTFTAEVLAQVLGIPLKNSIAALSGPLQDTHRLVIAEGVQRLDGRMLSHYRFRHSLIQAFMYEQVDPVERVHFHGAVAEALEQLYVDQREAVVVRLARHYRIAGQRRAAVRAYLDAGRLSGSLSAHQEAVEHLETGLGLLRSDPDLRNDASLELEFQLVLGPALIAGRGYADRSVEAVFQRARRLGRKVGSDREAFAARWGLWGFYTVRAKHSLARSMAIAMRQIAEQLQEPHLHLAALRSNGSTDFYLGQFGAAHAVLRQAEVLVDRTRKRGLIDLFGQDPEVDTLAYLSLTEWFLGHPTSARNRMAEAVSMANTRQHPYSEAFALTLQATLAYLERDFDLAAEAAQRAAAVAQKRGYPFWLAASKVMSGWSAAMLGEVERGLEEAQAGLEGWRATGAELVLPTFLAMIGELELGAARWDLAEQTLLQALALAEKANEQVLTPEILRLCGEVARHKSEFREAENYFRRSLEVAGRQGVQIPRLRAALSLAGLAQEVGSTSGWRAVLEEARQDVDPGEKIPEIHRVDEILSEHDQGIVGPR